MKKKILVGLAIVFLMVVLAYNALSTYAQGIPDLPADSVYYNRHELICPDGIKKETFCLKDGNELCDPQYCQ